ncbi:hypothetical protein D9758_005756 [Tetrapyrgos nigripes]|uniref:Uncharacterized protein n=1 Tax=Tetrapyrgos nigripes TaxID=182062 RepID=A0A8H5LQZ1_9AGAR|nr:hypothetical protein D9758_005756 [Tetrapyrgos nigripes]
MMRCPRLWKTTRLEKANKILLCKAPSTVVEQLQEGNQDSVKEPKQKKVKPVSDNPIMGNWMEEAKKLSREQRHTMIDKELTVHFSALPSTQIKSPSFRRAFILADRTYKMPTHTRLDEIFLPGQEVAILRTVLARLANEHNLTASFDGSTKSDEAYFTIHVSNMKRHVYLLEVRYATDEVHTAEQYASCSPVTAPTVSSHTDICHHLNNTNKDIVKLKYFEETIKIVRSTLKTFKRSHAAKSLLKAARHQLQSGASLESIGKTQFVTITLSSLSVQRTLPALQKVFQIPQHFEFDYKDYFQPTSHSFKARKFEDDLERLVSVGLPIAKSLTCLESNDANPADVFIFWHAACFEIERIVKDSDNSYPQEVQDDILDILNRRQGQLFGPGGRLYNRVYLVAAYLNAGYLSSDLFKDSDINPLEPTDPDTVSRLEETGIRLPRLYCFVFKYLFEIAANEARYGQRNEFTVWKGRAQDLLNALSTELKAYSRGRYPFNNPFPRDASTEEIIIWWRNCLTNDGTAVILPHVAIKLYAIRVNSMADEHTGSTFTAFTPANRSSMSVETMGGKTMVYQFYRQEEKIARSKAAQGPIKLKKFHHLKHKLYSGKASEKRTGDIEKVDGSEEVPEAEDDSWLSDDESNVKKEPAVDPSLVVKDTRSLLSVAKFINHDSDILLAVFAEGEASAAPDPSPSVHFQSLDHVPVSGEDNDFSTARISSFLAAV